MKKILLVSMLFTTFFVSCKKEECPVPVIPKPSVDLSGTTFIGTAVFPSITYNPFTIVLNADGTAVFTFSTLAPINGNWSKVPNSTTVNLFFMETSNGTTKTWKGNATFNETNNKLENGVLNRTAPTLLNGTFIVTKQ